MNESHHRMEAGDGDLKTGFYLCVPFFFFFFAVVGLLEKGSES